MSNVRFRPDRLANLKDRADPEQWQGYLLHRQSALWRRYSLSGQLGGCLERGGGGQQPRVWRFCQTRRPANIASAPCAAFASTMGAILPPSSSPDFPGERSRAI